MIINLTGLGPEPHLWFEIYRLICFISRHISRGVHRELVSSSFSIPSFHGFSYFKSLELLRFHWDSALHGSQLACIQGLDRFVTNSGGRQSG